LEFQNTGTALTSFGIHEICQKSGYGVEWVKKALLGQNPLIPRNKIKIYTLPDVQPDLICGLPIKKCNTCPMYLHVILLHMYR
jgi:hypothetical protein